MKRPRRRPPLQQRRQRSNNDDNKLLMTPSKTTTAVGWLLLLLTIHAAIIIAPTAAAAFIIISSPTMIGAYHTTTLSVGSSQQRRRHQYDCCYSDPIVRKSDQQHQRGRLATTRVLSLSSSSQTEGLDMDSLSYEMFKRRRDRIDLRKLVEEDDNHGKYYHGDDKDEQQQQQTPNEFVTQILRELRYPKLYPNHLSGVTMLLQSSTHAWRQTLYKSVGCNVDPPKLGGEDHNTSTVDETRIAQSLLSALSNINSQFGILVGVADDKEFVLDFPTEPVEYEDSVDSSSSDECEEDSSSSSACSSSSSSSSSCWLECRVRDKFTDELLLVMGWTLVKKEKSSWSIDSLDWQDFRDDFRPGIGREEWERICG